MPRYRVRIEETAIYDVIVSAPGKDNKVAEMGLEAFIAGYGDFVANVEREVISVKYAGD